MYRTPAILACALTLLLPGCLGAPVENPALPADTSDTDNTWTAPHAIWPSAACRNLADNLLSQMTRQEKAAQMVMAPNPPMDEVSAIAPGAVFAPGGAVPPGGTGAAAWAEMVNGYHAAAARSRLGIPIFYGADAVHGHNLATGTVIFPHNAGLASARDPALVQAVARITALEVAATGINWTFAPVVSVSLDDRWGRVYESFSEDPVLTEQLAAAAVAGLQGPDGLGSANPSVLASGKHFAGDGLTTPGTSFRGGIVDRGDIRVDQATMQRLGIDPYRLALQAGLGSVMVSDATWHGESLTGSHQLITEVLKGELGFQGFVITDWNAAIDGPGPGTAAAIHAGVDMLMQPADWQGAIATIEAEVDQARMDDAVRRILAVKCAAGLFQPQRPAPDLTSVGSAEHRAVARRAVRDSLVLLQNNRSALPLVPGGAVWVGGSGADDLQRQCGGWTIAWQGDGGLTDGTTIRTAVSRMTPVVDTWEDAQALVIVLSEPAYAEFMGDRESVHTLSHDDLGLLAAARNSGLPVVAILVTGRPVLITEVLDHADAWMMAWLPGTEGDGIADVLFGTHAPTGRLSHSWPRTDAQVNVNQGDQGYDPLFPLGHGLGY